MDFLNGRIPVLFVTLVNLGLRVLVAEFSLLARQSCVAP